MSVEPSSGDSLSQHFDDYSVKFLGLKSKHVFVGIFFRLLFIK